MLRPTDTFGRADGLITFAICLLLGSMVPAGEARAQATPYHVHDDVNEDPDQGQPQAQEPAPPLEPGTVFPWLRPPWSGELADLRRRAYDDYGLTFGASYQQLYQYASATLPSAMFNQALGGWAATSITWTPLDRGGDYQGTLVWRMAWRDSIGDHAVPAQFGLPQLGAIWSNYEFTTWNGRFAVEDLFWEQELGPFSFRVGNQIPTSVFNFFRFKDARTSFTASPFAFMETIPYPTFGLGASFRWQPVPDTESGPYIVGTLNDMNGDPAALGLDWSTFGLGQYFYGMEVGYNWRRPNGEFDHFHIDLFYADERSTRMPETSLNEPGGGFKVAVEKQVDRLVGFASYTYNTAEGGGISATVAGQTAVAGVAYVRPFDVRGEVAVGFMLSQSLPNIVPGIGRKDQYGVDTYWNIALAPDITLTPGVQLIWDPVLNPGVHFVAIPDIKFRVAF
jgi:hypothetical protein